MAEGGAAANGLCFPGRRLPAAVLYPIDFPAELGYFGWHIPR